MQWHTQAGNITTNLKVKIHFTLPELSMTKHLTWNCHVDDFSNGRQEIVLGRDILTAVWLNLNYISTSSKHIVMVDMDTHEFNILNTEKITPENGLQMLT